MDPAPNNIRYMLELERNALIEEKYGFDKKYGTFSFAFLTSFEVFALLAYLYIATVLIYYRKTRTKTNFIVSVWAIINFLVLLEKLSREFGGLIGNDFPISKNAAHISDMISGLARNYGTSLSIVWIFTKYFKTLKPKYDIFMYFLMSLPTLICISYIYYYFTVNQFIYEVYGPGCDVINAIVYLSVGVIFILGKIFTNDNQDSSNYSLIISLINLFTNFPISLLAIYIRFNLDIGWSYRFHIYFVDFFIDVLSVSSAFAVLYVVILYHEIIRSNFNPKKKIVNDASDAELVKMTQNC